VGDRVAHVSVVCLTARRSGLGESIGQELVRREDFDDAHKDGHDTTRACDRVDYARLGDADDFYCRFGDGLCRMRVSSIPSSSSSAGAYANTSRL